MKNTPWKEIAQFLGDPSSDETPIAGYAIDSRFLKPGELFFALPGEKTDGHRYLSDAKAKGALGAIVSNTYEGPHFGLPLVAVENVQDTLQSLARHAMEKKNIPVVAITGTMGKTTTKDFAATLLEGKYRVGKTYSSYNTRLTLPLTILNLEGNEEVLVLEMGMGEPGDIGKLVSIAPPDIAVLTAVAMAHYGDYFPGGVAEVAKAKAEIFHHPRTKQAIFTHGFYAFPELVQAIGCKKWSYSLEDRTADYFLSKGFIDERGVRAIAVDVPFPQPHVQHNFLAAIAVARALQVEWDAIEVQIPKLRLPKMRFEQFEKEGILFVNDAYNANPETVKMALSCLPEPKAEGKRIAILGRMIDLGPFSEILHTEVGKFARSYADHLLTLGEEAKPLCAAFAESQKPAEHFSDLSSVGRRLKELMRPGDVVLVKGSRDLAMERIFDAIAIR